MTFFDALFSHPLLQTALLAAFLSSIIGGVVGSYVVVKRIAFISGSIAHSVLGGMGFFLWLQRKHEIAWATPFLGALVAAVLSAWMLGWIHLKYRQREDAVIATLWSLGMAIGVIFISQTPGYNVELTSFLIGNILWVTSGDLVGLLVLNVCVIGTVILLHKRFLTICFDEDQAYLQGINVPLHYLLLLTLIAISVVVLIQVVGIILAITLLTLPATCAGLFTSKLSRMMLLASLLSAVLCFTGTAISFHLDWPTGATIALLATLIYLITLLIKRKR